jgi:hypothetical protein
LAFSYWIDIPWFRTKRKIAAIFIITFSWGFQLAGHLLHQLHANKFSGTIHHRAITFKKETMYKHRHRPDHRSWVFPQEKVGAHKEMPSTRPLPGTTNKGQTLSFHPSSLDYEFLMCCRPHKPMPLLQITNHQAKTSSPP